MEATSQFFKLLPTISLKKVLWPNTTNVVDGWLKIHCLNLLTRRWKTRAGSFELNIFSPASFRFSFVSHHQLLSGSLDKDWASMGTSSMSSSLVRPMSPEQESFSVISGLTMTERPHASCRRFSFSFSSSSGCCDFLRRFGDSSSYYSCTKI